MLRRIAELLRRLEPLTAEFLGPLSATISLTLYVWSICSLKGLYVVTAHWVCTGTLTSKSVLLTIIVVKSGLGAGPRVGQALFDYLKCLRKEIMTRLLDITTGNGGNATAAVKPFSQVANNPFDTDQFTKASHVLCANHSIQLAFVMLTSQIEQTIEAPRERLIRFVGAK